MGTAVLKLVFRDSSAQGAAARGELLTAAMVVLALFCAIAL